MQELKRRKTDMFNKGWLEIAVKFGVPALIAVYLVYVLAGDVRGQVENINRALVGHSAVSEHQSKALDKLIELGQRQFLISQEQCINSAITARRNPKECLK